MVTAMKSIKINNVDFKDLWESIFGMQLCLSRSTRNRIELEEVLNSVECENSSLKETKEKDFDYLWERLIILEENQNATQESLTRLCMALHKCEFVGVPVFKEGVMLCKQKI